MAADRLIVLTEVGMVTELKYSQFYSEYKKHIKKPLLLGFLISSMVAAVLFYLGDAFAALLALFVPTPFIAFILWISPFLELRKGEKWTIKNQKLIISTGNSIDLRLIKDWSLEEYSDKFNCKKISIVSADGSMRMIVVENNDVLNDFVSYLARHSSGRAHT